MLILFYIYTLIQLYVQDVDSAGFDYKNIREWAEHYETCGGRYQSPINLKFGQFAKIGELSALKWFKYGKKPTRMTLVNNGHSITLSGVWPSNSIPYIAGGPLPDAYIFEQLHFHWGNNDSVGSEHTINGNSFPLEMHMVHFKRQYGTFANATNYKDGLAVVGLFFDIEPTGSDGLTRILGGASGVQSVGEMVELNPFPLSEFDCAGASLQFVTYAGSLTTPPCSEIVTWIIPIAILKTTRKQMKTFRSIQLDHNDDHNYRPTQPLNDRIIHIFTQWSTFYMSDVYQIHPSHY